MVNIINRAMMGSDAQTNSVLVLRGVTEHAADAADALFPDHFSAAGAPESGRRSWWAAPSYDGSVDEERFRLWRTDRLVGRGKIVCHPADSLELLELHQLSPRSEAASYPALASSWGLATPRQTQQLPARRPLPSARRPPRPIRRLQRGARLEAAVRETGLRWPSDDKSVTHAGRKIQCSRVVPWRGANGVGASL